MAVDTATLGGLKKKVYDTSGRSNPMHGEGQNPKRVKLKKPKKKLGGSPKAKHGMSGKAGEITHPPGESHGYDYLMPLQR